MRVLYWANCLAKGTTLGTLNLSFAVIAVACNVEAHKHTMRNIPTVWKGLLIMCTKGRDQHTAGTVPRGHLGLRMIGGLEHPVAMMEILGFSVYP